MSIFNDVFDMTNGISRDLSLSLSLSLSLDFLEKIHRNINIYLKAKHKNINSIQTSSSLGVYYQ
jgi:hypothetical protein